MYRCLQCLDGAVTARGSPFAAVCALVVVVVVVVPKGPSPLSPRLLLESASHRHSTRFRFRFRVEGEQAAMLPSFAHLIDCLRIPTGGFFQAPALALDADRPPRSPSPSRRDCSIAWIPELAFHDVGELLRFRASSDPSKPHKYSSNVRWLLNGGPAKETPGNREKPHLRLGIANTGQ